MNIWNADRLFNVINTLEFTMKRMTRISLICLIALAVGSAFGQTQDTVTTFTYDILGNVKTINRPLSRTTSYS